MFELCWRIYLAFLNNKIKLHLDSVTKKTLTRNTDNAVLNKGNAINNG